MKNIDEITIKDIHALVDSKVFDRGKEYFGEGAVLDPAYDGNKMYADVEGSSHGNYKTEVRIERGRLQCECSCPYEWGVCKHVVALLLHWINKKDDFNDAGKKRVKATNMPRSELVKIVGILAKEEPQVFLKVMDYVFPEGFSGNVPAPDFAKKAERLLKEGADYHEIPAFLRQLEVWRKHIKIRLESKQYDYVAKQLGRLTEACIKNYGMVDDSSGKLSEFSYKCLEDIKSIWSYTSEDVRIILLKLFWELEEDNGLEDELDYIILKLCKTDTEKSVLRKPIIQKLVSLEDNGSKNSKSINHYNYERVFDLALKLGYINRKGVYLQG